MAYTEASLLTQVRSILNEPSEQFFDDTEITAWLKEAAIDISTKTMCVETSAAVTVTAGTLDATEPTDCLKVYAVYISNKGLMRIHPRQIAHITPTPSTIPQFYYHFAGKLGFYPIASTGMTATVLYSKLVDSVVNLPYEYQEYAIDYAVYRAKLKDGKYAQANHVLSKYLNSLIFHRQDLYEKGVDSKDMFKIPDYTVTSEK
uniref:Uncharacterized protein n=1 Tax=viral metagenome TaxID=1070528 RepID=A0A6M3XAB4_9ZZZZ